MISNTIKEKAMEIFDSRFQRDTDGGGFSRNVYHLDDNYVLKIDSVDCDYVNRQPFMPSTMKRVKTDVLHYLNNREKTIAGFKFFSYKKNPSVKAFCKFCETLEIEENSNNLNIYLNFLYHSPSFQNLPDYFNYLALKDNRKVNKFLPKMLGVIIENGYVMVIQERGKTFNRYWSLSKEETHNLNSAMREIADAFDCANLGLRDIKAENIILTKDGKYKICDLGIEHYYSYYSYNYN